MSDSEQQQEQKQEPINYGEHQYWDERYSKTEGDRFEWLQSFENLQVSRSQGEAEIEKALHWRKHSRILHVGCGNSALQDRLYEAGYHAITNIDISGVVIEQMNKVREQKGYHHMTYEVGDVRHLRFPNETFDMVLDKSTIDTLMCTDNPITNVAKMVDEAYRVLVPDGVYFVLSYASAATRLEHITRDHVSWQVERKEVSRLNEEGEKLVHFLYICRKRPLPAERTAPEWREAYFAQLKKLEEEEYPS